jgi:sulfhydrogenase subunit gamma (sulfur reductase)
MSIYQPELARITRASSPTGFDRLLEIELPDGRSLGHRAGQFVELSSFGIGEAPISLCSAPIASGRFELCIRDMGGVTSHLQRLGAGDTVGVRGPYGNGFPLEAMAGKDCLIVAGGIGLAPLRSLVQSLLVARSRYGRLVVMYGAREPGELLFGDDLAAWAEHAEVMVTVDRPVEGWTGHVGVVTTLFSEVKLGPPRALVAAVVGPPVMYRFVLAELAAHYVPDDQIFISLERRMRCGVGKCGHCKVDGREVCIHGPVFSGAEVKGFHETL